MVTRDTFRIAQGLAGTVAIGVTDGDLDFVAFGVISFKTAGNVAIHALDREASRPLAACHRRCQPACTQIELGHTEVVKARFLVAVVKRTNFQQLHHHSFEFSQEVYWIDPGMQHQPLSTQNQ